jgi:glucoamylase
MPTASRNGLAAAAFIVRNGPATRQDRWEEDGGYSPFTLGMTVTALLAAAGFLERRGFPAHTIQYLRETADWINDSIENWTYAQATSLAKAVGVDGYYVRIGPIDLVDDVMPPDGVTVIKNRDGRSQWPSER